MESLAVSGKLIFHSVHAFLIIILVEHTFNLTQQPNIWMKIELKMDMKFFKERFFPKCSSG